METSHQRPGAEFQNCHVAVGQLRTGGWTEKWFGFQKGFRNPGLQMPRKVYIRWQICHFHGSFIHVCREALKYYAHAKYITPDKYILITFLSWFNCRLAGDSESSSASWSRGWQRVMAYKRTCAGNYSGIWQELGLHTTWMSGLGMFPQSAILKHKSIQLSNKTSLSFSRSISSSNLLNFEPNSIWRCLLSLYLSERQIRLS